MKAKMLENQVAIVTGGAQGLGLAMVKKFSEEGAKVVVADVNYLLAQKVADEINAAGNTALALEVDVANIASARAMADKVIETYGRIDILINNAGIVRDAMLHKMTDETWDMVLKVNLYGTYNCTRCVVDQMIAQKFGRIVNLSSAARLGGVGQTNYSATKAGVCGLARTWGKELGKHNITANAIAPGGINTELFQKVPDQYKERAIKAVPLRRMGEPEDVANLALFLVSEMGAYINAQVIHCDGGTLCF